MPVLPGVRVPRGRPAVRCLRPARPPDDQGALAVLGVDVGGTFTDVVSVRDGRIEVTKVPSDAIRPAGPVVEGVRRLGA